ncbi:MAG: thermonuclease family protein [Deltaproteobacteria bacterium]|nr:thermonuclease family protein [Deltaproteobacteria bacterium]
MPIGWILLAFLCISFFSCPLAAQEWQGVAYVVDGDTIILKSGEKVRYIGIDTPEIAHEGRPAEPFGDAARAYNRQLTGNKRVRMEIGSESRDRYGRLLAYLFLEDGTFVNQDLISSGLAVFLYKPPNVEHADLLLQAQRSAMKGKKGLWGALSPTLGTYIGNRHSKRFHLPTCPYGRRTAKANRVFFSHQWEAYWEGYSPCRRCLK